MEYIKGIEVKAAENGIITAYAAVFNNVDLVGDIIRPGSFTKTIQERKGRIQLIANHNPYDVLGDLSELHEDEKGLFLEAKMKDNDFSGEWYEKAKDGSIAGLSIGYDPMKYAVDRKAGIREISETILYETTLVGEHWMQANPLAQIVDVKSIKKRLLKNKELSNSDTLAIQQLISQAEIKSLDPNEQRLIEIAEFYKLINI